MGCLEGGCADGRPRARSVVEPSSKSVPASKVDTAKEEKDIGAMLDDWHDAAAKADEARYFEHLDEGAVFMGTDAHERWDKAAFLAYAHPHFAKGKAWSFRARRRNVVLDGPGFAHFDEDLETEKLGEARGSGVASSSQGEWRIVQYNLAITVPNERFASVQLAIEGVPLEHEMGGLEGLSWLAGAWVTDPASGSSDRTIEIWAPPAGRTMVGMSRSTKGDVTAFSESLRIEARGERIVLIANPKGQAQAELVFDPAASTAKRAMFTNPKHDAPKSIVYERDGDLLIARTEGGGPPSEWRYRRAVLPP